VYSTCTACSLNKNALVHPFCIQILQASRRVAHQQLTSSWLCYISCPLQDTHCNSASNITQLAAHSTVSVCVPLETNPANTNRQAKPTIKAQSQPLPAALQKWRPHNTSCHKYQRVHSAVKWQQHPPHTSTHYSRLYMPSGIVSRCCLIFLHLCIMNIGRPAAGRCALSAI